MNYVDPYSSESKKQKIGLAIGAGLLLVGLIIGFGIAALGLQRPQNESVALAQQPTGNNAVLPAVGNEVEPALPIQKPDNVTMPDDIYNWLEHLRRTDEKLSAETNSIGMSAGIGRMSGLADMYGQALDGNFEDYDPSSQSQSLNNATQETFDELEYYFDSYPPPTECLPIYNAYKISLSETEANINQISRLMEQAMSTAMSGGSTDGVVNDLRGIYSGHRDGIDEHRRQTDLLVQQICDKYRTRKWFNIKADPANPIMQGMVDMLLSSLGN